MHEYVVYVCQRNVEGVGSNKSVCILDGYPKNVLGVGILFGIRLSPQVAFVCNAVDLFRSYGQMSSVTILS